MVVWPSIVKQNESINVELLGIACERKLELEGKKGGGGITYPILCLYVFAAIVGIFPNILKMALSLACVAPVNFADSSAVAARSLGILGFM
jgi:hypothetical protein